MWTIYFLFFHPVTSRPDLVLHFQSLLGAGAGQAAAEEEAQSQEERRIHPEK